MYLAEFGRLIKALRKRGVDQLGNSWTRESLCKAVHLSAEQLGRLERGDRKYLDTRTLMLLAKAFNLTKLEQKEFFYAALGLANEDLFEKEDPANQLNTLFCEIECLKIPALIIDAYSDLVAVNTGALNLFLATPETLNYTRHIPAGQNLIYLIYAPEFGSREIFGSSWRDMATVEILLFRRSTLRYRHTDYFKHLMKTLLKIKQFDIDWYSSHKYADQYNLTYEHFKYNHPRYGPLSYLASETVINTKKGELYLLAYNPADSTTASVFATLTGSNGNKAYRLASWPDKRVP